MFWLEIVVSLLFAKLSDFLYYLIIDQKIHISHKEFDFKPEICQEHKKLAWARSSKLFCGDFNACNKEDNWKMKQFCDQDYDLPDFENDSSL